MLPHMPPKHSVIAQQSQMQWRQFFSEFADRTNEPLLRDLMELANSEDVISFAAGITPPELYPEETLQNILGRIIEECGLTVLLHTPTEGHYPLRESISRLLGKRNITVSPEETLVLAGSQQGLDLAARAFIDSGDTIIVEEPSFFCALQAFKAAGARLIGVPADENGMRVDLLESLFARYKPKFIYTMPTFQNPSGVVMDLERRHQLLELAYRYQVPILEDDPYGELRYEGEPLPSLKALDRFGYVMYLSTFSKILFPGLRLGWIAALRPVIRQFTLIKQMTDLHSNSLSQYLLDSVLREGILERHIKTVSKEYARRRDIMFPSPDKIKEGIGRLSTAVRETISEGREREKGFKVEIRPIV